MGSILSRRIAGVEDIDIQANSAYRYPPKSGKIYLMLFYLSFLWFVKTASLMSRAFTSR